MVIPMGGIGTPMMGPFPADLQGRFRQLRALLLTIIAAALTQFIACQLIPGAETMPNVMSALNVFLNVVFGIFLLREDATIGRMYKCLTTTICQTCADQCGGGVQCLLPYIVNCVIMVVFAIPDLFGVPQMINLIFHPDDWTSDNLLGFWLFLAVFSQLAVFISQALSAYLSWQVYKAIRDGAVQMTGGDWAAGAAGAQGSGGAPMNPNPWGQQEAGQEAAAARQPNFSAFQGQGARLGS